MENDGGEVIKLNRAQLRGKPLDDFCKLSKPIKETDGNYYCYGLIDLMTDETEKECLDCNAFIGNHFME